MRSLVILTVLGVVLGCSRDEPSPPAHERAAAAVSSHAIHPPGAPLDPSAPLVLARGVRFVKAGEGDDVAKLVRSEREKTAADGRDLLVYVGAKWCEPCQRFHVAAQRGDLDADFPELTILEFDLDEDRERIMAAGYESKLIPLFVVPRKDGRASERRFEGGIKGDGAVSHLAPRLRKLLAK